MAEDPPGCRINQALGCTVQLSPRTGTCCVLYEPLKELYSAATINPTLVECSHTRASAKSHFRIEQLEAVLVGSLMKLLRAWQRRSVSS